VTIRTSASRLVCSTTLVTCKIVLRTMECETRENFKQFLANYWHWQKLIYHELGEVIYRATLKIQQKDWRYFSLQIHAEKILTSMLTSSTRRHTNNQSVCVRGSKWRQMFMCVKIARTLGLEYALLLFSTDVWRYRLSIVCVDHRVTIMHFWAAAIFRHRSCTQRRSVYRYIDMHSSE